MLRCSLLINNCLLIAFSEPNTRGKSLSVLGVLNVE